MQNILSKNSILNFIFIILLFFLTRQVPFSKYSIFMNISVLALVLFYFIYNRSIKLNLRKKFVILFLCTLFIHLCYSIFFTQSQYKNSLKFFLVIFFLVIAYDLKKLPVKFINIFIFFLSAQAIVLFITEIFCLFFLDSTNIALLRDFVRSNEWGDIYSNGLFYHIQIKGNALLPFAYMVTFLNHNGRQYVVRIILLLGLIFAGNFAFLLSILIFHFIQYLISLKHRKNIYIKIITGFILILLTLYPIYSFTVYKLNSKIDDSIYERLEQKKYLLEDLTRNPIVLLFGNGLGCTLNKQSSTRDYRESTYFEIQPLYFLDQLGIILFSLFIFLNIYLAILNFQDNLILLAYACYIIYSFTNPYILDTNHLIVIIILNTLQYFKEKQNNNKILQWKFLQ
jgi:hypothetical protein